MMSGQGSLLQVLFGANRDPGQYWTLRQMLALCGSDTVQMAPLWHLGLLNDGVYSAARGLAQALTLTLTAGNMHKPAEGCILEEGGCHEG